MTPKATGAIAERAMLVDLNISNWGAVKHDKKISGEVATQHNSDVNMGRFNKRLLAKEALEKVKRIGNQARLEHYRLTLAWSDDGPRILGSAGYFGYCEFQRKKEAEYWAAVDEFVAAYPELVLEAQRRLNGLFNQADYPKPERIRAKFAFTVAVTPLPRAEDFRCNLAKDDVAAMRSLWPARPPIRASTNPTTGSWHPAISSIASPKKGMLNCRRI